MILVAEQTQFAVGQGGLHLAQLQLSDYVQGPDVPSKPLSVVYDCGGHGDPAALRRGLQMLRRSLPSGNDGVTEHLDVLVLSHLHADHINGFKRLVAGVPLTIGKLIIPHYDDEHQLALLAQVAASTGDIAAVLEVSDVLRDPATWFGERRVASVTAIRPGDEDTRPFVPFSEGVPSGFDPSSPAETERVQLDATWRIRGTIDRIGQMTVVDPGTHLAIQSATRSGTRATDWVFVPYCQRWNSGDGRLARHPAFVQAVQKCLAPHRQTDGSLLVRPSAADAMVRCLTTAFRTYVGSSASSATWNTLSLSLFGGPLRHRKWRHWRDHARFDTAFIDEDLYCDASYWQRLLLDSAELRFAWHPAHHLNSYDRDDACGWMMTGDSDLTGGASAWNQFYSALLPQVGCFQLPHHGSGHNSDDQLPLGGTMLPFVTCRNGDQKHPAPHIEAFLANRGLHLARVTTDPHSTIRSIALLKV